MNCKHDYRRTGGVRYAIYRPGYSDTGEDTYTCKVCGHFRIINIKAVKLNEPTITDEDLDKINSDLAPVEKE